MTTVLDRSWGRAWSGVGAIGGGIEVRDDLLRRHAEPHRRYHTLQHLSECLALLDAHRGEAEDPAAVEVALWFHDAIYDVKRADNEERSAALAFDALARNGAGSRAPAVRDLVLATRHTGAPARPDERLIVDIDLAILGAEADRFAEYEEQVRGEYAWVPAWIYRRKRRKILRGFLERPSLYSTPALRDALEARARENLARATS